MRRLKVCSKGNPRKVDKCIALLVRHLKMEGINLVASCCGHGKYPMTLLVKSGFGSVYDMVSGKVIRRKSRFYVKDKHGVFYVLETIEKEVENYESER